MISLRHRYNNHSLVVVVDACKVGGAFVLVKFKFWIHFKQGLVDYCKLFHHNHKLYSKVGIAVIIEAHPAESYLI